MRYKLCFALFLSALSHQKETMIILSLWQQENTRGTLEPPYANRHTRPASSHTHLLNFCFHFDVSGTPVEFSGSILTGCVEKKLTIDRQGTGKNNPTITYCKVSSCTNELNAFL